VRFLVTGGAGFIGSHYVRTLLTGGYHVRPDAVTVLDLLTYAGNLENLAPVADDPRYTFVRGDIADPDVVMQVVPGHDVVVNFAAESHVDRSIVGPADFVRTNVLGVQVLLDACLRAAVPTVVQVSTDEVYGPVVDGSATEETPLAPSSPYSAGKAGGDLVALAYTTTYGLDVRVTRCTNNYGPYQYPEKVIPLFVTNLIDGLRVPLYGDGLHIRDWLHVDDHCRGIQLVVEQGHAGTTYNIAGGTELTNRERRGLVIGRAGDRPARPRPALLPRRLAAARNGLRAEGRLRTRPPRDGAVVPRSRVVVAPSHHPRCTVSRWLVTGAGGQLGRELVRALDGEHVVALTSSQLDIRDRAAVNDAVRGSNADVVVNAAAWTDVDGAESDEAGAFAVNADGAAHVADACAAAGATIVHISTDYVFDGSATTPYAEDEPTNPVSAYGRSKAAGEQAVLASGASAYVVRTAWLYGAGGHNFVRTMARLARASDDPVNVVDDQVGAPTWTAALATAVIELAATRPISGVCHATCAGRTSWFGFAQTIFAAVGADVRRVHPIPTSSFPRPARRPAFSVLSGNAWVRAGLTPLPSWDDAFASAVTRDGAALIG
jgi:dTDP-glucose 4,6-dehydratase